MRPSGRARFRMSCDRPARRCITSVDDRRCERGHPHTALGLGLRAATRVASLPTWVVTGGCRRSGHAPAVSSGHASPHGEALMGRGRAWAARFSRQPHAIAIPSPSAARMRHVTHPRYSPTLPTHVTHPRCPPTLLTHVTHPRYPPTLHSRAVGTPASPRRCRLVTRDT